MQILFEASHSKCSDVWHFQISLSEDCKVECYVHCYLKTLEGVDKICMPNFDWLSWISRIIQVSHPYSLSLRCFLLSCLSLPASYFTLFTPLSSIFPPSVTPECECHGHADSCHFSQRAWLSSGGTSGGVCDDCRHNTVGRRCQRCRHGYHRHPARPLISPYACTRKRGGVGGVEGLTKRVNDAFSTIQIGHQAATSRYIASFIMFEFS